MDVSELARDYSRVQLSRDEMLILNAVLNEVCNGIALFEFETRIGANREVVSELLKQMNETLDKMDSLGL